MYFIVILYAAVCDHYKYLINNNNNNNNNLVYATLWLYWRSGSTGYPVGYLVSGRYPVDLVFSYHSGVFSCHSGVFSCHSGVFCCHFGVCSCQSGVILLSSGVFSCPLV